MLQRLSPPSAVSQGSLLFSGTHQRSGQPWRQVVRQGPLLLIGGAWLVLVSISALAYHQLILTKPDPEVGATLTPRPQMAAIQPLAPVHPPDEVLTVPRDAQRPAPVASPVGASWLVSLVGLCGLGCWLITLRCQAAPRRSRRTAPLSRKRAPATPTASKRSSPKRLASYRPDRDDVVVAPSLATAPSLAAPQLPQPESGSEARPEPGQPPLAPDLVPDQDVLRLDWPEASLAHSLDLRQRRSLSSLL